MSGPKITPREEGRLAALAGKSIDSSAYERGSKDWSRFRAGFRDGEEERPKKRRKMTYSPETYARLVENARKNAAVIWGTTPEQRQAKARALSLMRKPAKPRKDGMIWVSALVAPEVKESILMSAHLQNMSQRDYLSATLTSIHRKKAA